MLIRRAVEGPWKNVKNRDMNGKEYDEWKSYTTRIVRVNQLKKQKKSTTVGAWSTVYFYFFSSNNVTKRQEENDVD